jgi:tetratricopeptide (TPR) repeat protein
MSKSHVFAALLIASTAFTSIAFAHGDDTRKRGKEIFTPSSGFAAEAKDTATGRAVQLYKNIGKLSMAVTTTNEEAQAYFNQGWLFTWGFNHAEAVRSFREAQKLDPNFAMAYWGEALALGPNINMPMTDDVVVTAYEAIGKAKALSKGVTAKERTLIDALSRRYGANPMVQRSGLDNDWVVAMNEVAKAFPGDADVQVLHADAMMNLQPWDYWEADGKTPKKNAGAIVAALETALSVNPNHAGAQHLYLHAVEASSTPERGEAVADALRGKTPGVGHLLHMPSHIYMRLGRHGDGIAVNADAVAADERLIASAGDETSALFRYGYYPHNVHFLMVSAQMAGVADQVFSAAEKLDAVTSDQVSRDLAWVQAIKTAPYTAHAQFADAETILAMEAPDASFPYVKGFWHYARALAYIAKGDTAKAQAESDAIGELIATADFASLEAQFLPAKSVLALARLVAEARIAQAAKDYAKAEEHLRKAIELEDGMPYQEPAYWYYPMRQTLGAVLLQQGRAEESAEMFRAALSKSPRNGWVLWGLMQAQKAAGGDGLAETEAAFERAWLGDRSMLRLDRL